MIKGVISNEWIRKHIELFRNNIFRTSQWLYKWVYIQRSKNINYIKQLQQKLQQKEDIIYKIKKCIEEKEEYYGDYMGDGNYTMYSMMGINNNRIPYIKSNLIKQILDNKGE